MGLSITDTPSFEDLFAPTAFGFDPAADRGAGGLESGVAAATRTGNDAPLWSPDNPLFWFGGFLLAAFGLVFVSTHIKAGPVRANVSI